MQNQVEVINPHNFEQDNHFFSKALNSQLHPLVEYFFNLDHERLIKRYKHLHPQVDADALRDILKYQSKHFFRGGSDLFYTTNEKGNRRMVVLETNSCPAGQRCMPPLNDADEYRGYRSLIENSFLPQLKKRRLPKGVLAVIYDKNYMDNSGYASTLADLTGGPVYLVPCMNGENSPVIFENGIMYITTPEGKSIPVRAALRHVTQKPWNRIPPTSKTFIYNSTLVCLAGGRNKLVANKAYEFYNTTIAKTGLKISIPETIKDVSKLEIPLWVEKFGGRAVIKIPYSNAGQGVFTVTTREELDAFMEKELPLRPIHRTKPDWTLRVEFPQ